MQPEGVIVLPGGHAGLAAGFGAACTGGGGLTATAAAAGGRGGGGGGLTAAVVAGAGAGDGRFGFAAVGGGVAREAQAPHVHPPREHIVTMGTLDAECREIKALRGRC